MACKQNVHHTEHDSEAGLQKNMWDEFFGSISHFHCWTLKDRLYALNNGCSAYLCSLFSCHISSAFYVSIYFSRLFSSLKSFSLGRSDSKSSPGQFLSLEAKAVFYCSWCAYGLSMNIFVFLSPLNWHKRPYGCWTKSWTNFFIFKIQMEAALSWMPEWKNGQGTWSKEGF